MYQSFNNKTDKIIYFSFLISCFVKVNQYWSNRQPIFSNVQAASKNIDHLKNNLKIISFFQQGYMKSKYMITLNLQCSPVNVCVWQKILNDMQS